MIALTVKMKSGEAFSAQMETLEQARELIANKPYFELAYQDAFVVINSSEVAFIAASAARPEGQVDTMPIDLAPTDS